MLSDGSTDRQTDIMKLTVAFRHLQTRLKIATIRKYSKPIECFAKCGLSFDGKIRAIYTKYNIYNNNARFLISPLRLLVA